MRQYFIGEVHPKDHKAKEAKGWGRGSSSGSGGDASSQRGWFSQILFGMGLSLVGIAMYKAIF